MNPSWEAKFDKKTNNILRDIGLKSEEDFFFIDYELMREYMKLGDFNVFEVNMNKIKSEIVGERNEKEKEKMIRMKKFFITRNQVNYDKLGNVTRDLCEFLGICDVETKKIKNYFDVEKNFKEQFDSFLSCEKKDEWILKLNKLGFDKIYSRRMVHYSGVKTFFQFFLIF